MGFNSRFKGLTYQKFRTFTVFWSSIYYCKVRGLVVKSIIQRQVFRVVQYWHRLLHVMSNIVVISAVHDTSGVEMA